MLKVETHLLAVRRVRRTARQLPLALAFTIAFLLHLSLLFLLWPVMIIAAHWLWAFAMLESKWCQKVAIPGGLIAPGLPKGIFQADSSRFHQRVGLRPNLVLVL